MPLNSDDARYHRLLAAVGSLHGETLDPLGRPRPEHFERVVQRLLQRNPQAPKAQIEAAILHDVITHPAGGYDFLAAWQVAPDTVAILERIMPPPNANYFQDIASFTPADNLVYLDYIKAMIADNQHDAAAVKLADIEDTCDLLAAVGSEVCLRELDRQYEPSRKLLEAGLERMQTASDRA